VLWTTRPPGEPIHEGKRLSAWLDELRAVDYARRHDQTNSQLQAVRAIGTNAIPWLLHQYRRDSSARWKWKANELLKKQSFITFRFESMDTRLGRATTGFRALGELAEPAIPVLMNRVEEIPGYVPCALAGIGRPAIPALQRCLENGTLYTNSLGVYAIVPGNTIAEIFNATSLGPLTKADTAVFLPAIEAWAKQSTNRQAQRKANDFLNGYPSLP
jgi:hypothetical protein